MQQVSNKIHTHHLKQTVTMICSDCLGDES